MNRNSIENKWIVDEGHQITGLVHPRTKKEAVSEMERLGISGSLHARSRFEKSRRFKAFMLGGHRAMMKVAIHNHAASLLSGDYNLIKQLVDLGIALPEKQNAVVAHATKKADWCDTASKKSLDAYDPSADNWPD